MPTRDKKLEQLVALSHILNSFGGMQQVQQSGALGLAGIDQRERQDIRQEALAKLGLQMQQSQQEALAKHQQELLAQQAGFHTEDRTFAQSQLDSQAKHQAALEALQARQLEQQANSDATKYGLETVFHQQAQDSAKEQQARMLQQQMLEGMTRLPGTTPEAFAQMGQAMNIPGVDTFINSGKDSMATSQAAAMQQMMGPVYSQFKSEPSKAQSALDILWQDHRMQSPAVQEKLREPLRMLNEGIYNPVAANTQANASRTTARKVGDYGGDLGWAALDLVPDLWNAAPVNATNFLLDMFGSSQRVPYVTPPSQSFRAADQYNRRRNPGFIPQP